MIYIDYLGTHDSFTGTLEGDNWKITSVTEHQITQEKIEVNTSLITRTHEIFTVEISNEFGKSIKFDVDCGTTLHEVNPKYEKNVYYSVHFREPNYIHLKIGSSERLAVVNSRDKDGKVSIVNNLSQFLRKEMNFVKDYFNKVKTVELKKKDIEKDFDK